MNTKSQRLAELLIEADEILNESTNTFPSGKFKYDVLDKYKEKSLSEKEAITLIKKHWNEIVDKMEKEWEKYIKDLISSYSKDKEAKNIEWSNKIKEKFLADGFIRSHLVPLSIRYIGGDGVNHDYDVCIDMNPAPDDHTPSLELFITKNSVHFSSCMFDG